MIQDIDGLFAERILEADEFYSFAPATLSADAKSVQRQAFAGVLWSKQFYHFVVETWLKGDPGQPPPPASRLHGPRLPMGSPIQQRRHFHARQVGISVVRRLGSGVSHDSFGAGGSGFRENATQAVSARMVFASQRADSGV